MAFLTSKVSRKGCKAQWIAGYPDAESYLTFFNSRLPAPPNYTRFRDSMFDE